jgi:hypothetical protein
LHEKNARPDALAAEISLPSDRRKLHQDVTKVTRNVTKLLASYGCH